MKRKDLTNGEKIGILERLAQTPRPSQELVAEETHHSKTKIGLVLKEFRSITWEQARVLCDNDKNILRLRNDYSARLVEEEKEVSIKAKKALEKLENEKATILVRLADQARETAHRAGERYIDPFTGAMII